MVKIAINGFGRIGKLAFMAAVERDSVDIKKAEYMQNKIGEEYEGIVSSITQFGMFVELENTVEGLIRFEDMGNEEFVQFSQGNCEIRIYP